MNRAQRRHRDATVPAVARGRINTRSTSCARDDREWFQQRSDKSHRVRDRFPGEDFGSRNDPTLDMVAVRQIAAGVRVQTSADRDLELAIASACLDCFDTAIVHDLGAIQQHHGDVRAAIRYASKEHARRFLRAKRLFKAWLDHEAGS